MIQYQSDIRAGFRCGKHMSLLSEVKTFTGLEMPCQTGQARDTTPCSFREIQQEISRVASVICTCFVYFRVINVEVCNVVF